MSTKMNIIADLGDGLIMRRSTPQDADALSKFNGRIHVDPGEDFAKGVAVWTYDLLTKKHPSFNPADFTIIEDSKSGEIISSMNLIDQTWAYEGIEFGVGRPEVVGTLPEYRRRGLVRKQFDVVHRWSAERGHMLQAITGIPWYYRLFGYEMALDLEGGRRGYNANIPKLKEGEQEPYLVRRALKGDIPFIAQLHQQNSQRYPITCCYDEEMWRYKMFEVSPESEVYQVITVIESVAGERLGFLLHGASLKEGMLDVRVYELQPGVSWLAVTPSVLRYLQQTGSEYASKEEKGNGSNHKNHPRFEGYYFHLCSEHPVYHAVPHCLPQHTNPYAWFIRLPDLIAFMQHISPALEERLARSYAAGHTISLKLNFYTSGIVMVLEKGRIKAVEAWGQPDYETASAQFPELTFLQLLFGYRSLDELDRSFADCYPSLENPEGGQVLRALFPKKPSTIYPVD